MICVWITAIALSSGMLDVLDEHEGPWVAEGWEITEEVIIDPTEYLDYLPSSGSDQIFCCSAFVEEDGKNLWRLLLGYDGKVVVLQEDEPEPKVLEVEARLRRASMDCGFFLTSEDWPPTEARLVDADDGSFSPPYLFSRRMGVLVSNSGRLAGITNTPLGAPGGSRLYSPAGFSFVEPERTPGRIESFAYAPEGDLIVTVVQTEEGRVVIAYDWDLNRLWEANAGSSTSGGYTKIAVSENARSLAYEIKDGRMYTDGLAITDGRSGENLLRVLENEVIISFAISEDGTIVGITAGPRPFPSNGENFTIDDYLIQGNTELAVLSPFDSTEVSRVACYSDRYILAEIVEIENDGSCLIVLQEKQAVRARRGRSNITTCLLEASSEVIWVSEPVPPYAPRFRYHGAPSHHFPIRSLCKTEGGYRIIGEHDDGATIAITTLEKIQ